MYVVDFIHKIEHEKNNQVKIELQETLVRETLHKMLWISSERKVPSPKKKKKKRPLFLKNFNRLFFSCFASFSRTPFSTAPSLPTHQSLSFLSLDSPNPMPHPIIAPYYLLIVAKSCLFPRRLLVLSLMNPLNWFSFSSTLCLLHAIMNIRRLSLSDLIIVSSFSEAIIILLVPSSSRCCSQPIPSFRIHYLSPALNLCQHLRTQGSVSSYSTVFLH